MRLELILANEELKVSIQEKMSEHNNLVHDIVSIKEAMELVDDFIKALYESGYEIEIQF